MWPYDQTSYNPIQPQANPYLVPQQTGPRMEVVRVNGRGGADAFRMGPNSSALLLDESGMMIWAVSTDGAGYKTIVPYDVTLHQDAPPPDFNSLETRLKRLEEIVNGNSGNLAAAQPGEPGAGTN